MYRKLLSTAFAVSLFSLLLPIAALGAPTDCFGQRPTITGRGGDEVLKGTPGDDVIAGGGGDDVISGLGGNDLICGEGGVDKISGGPGDDRLSGARDPKRRTSSASRGPRGWWSISRPALPAARDATPCRASRSSWAPPATTS